MRTLSPAALIGAFAAAGLATISKEVAVLIVPVLYYAVWHDGGWRGWLRPPGSMGNGRLRAGLSCPFPADAAHQPITQRVTSFC